MKHAAKRFRRVRVPLSEPSFRRLWLALLTSDFGDAIGRIALVILVYQETGSGFAAALVPALSVAPFLGFGQVLTSYLDKWPRRTVLVGADLVRAVAFGAMALPIGTPARLALLTISSAVEPPFLAVRRAVVPNTISANAYGDGVALLSATTEIALLSGAAVGGLLTAAVGAPTVMAINSVTFVVSALSLLGLRLARVDVASTTRERMRNGWTVMRADPILRKVWVWFPALSATALGAEAIITPYVFDELGRGDTAVGVLAGVISIGVLGSAALLPRRSKHLDLFRQMGWVAAVGSAVAAFGFLFSADWSAVLAFVGVGIIFSARIPSHVLYGERLDEAARASAASLADGAYAVAQIGGSLLAGVCVDWLGAGDAARAVAFTGIAAGLVVLLLPIRGADLSADGADVEAETRSRQ